jgi:hypothetical protein
VLTGPKAVRLEVALGFHPPGREGDQFGGRRNPEFLFNLSGFNSPPLAAYGMIDLF